MSRKFFTAAAIAVCLALVFAAIPAAERTRANSDRAKKGSLARTPAENPNIAESYDSRFDPTAGRHEQVALHLRPEAEVAVRSGEDLPLEPGPVLADKVKKAHALLSFAGSLEGEEALSILRGILALDLDPGTKGVDRILELTHERLAGLMEETPRQLFHLERAYDYAAPELRPALGEQILALGGTVPQEPTDPLQITQRDFGADDVCSGAQPVGFPSTTLMSIADPIVFPGVFIEDVNYLSFDVPEVPQPNKFLPLIGQVVKIETTSPFCSTEAECSCPDPSNPLCAPGEDFDTALNLYLGCSPSGNPLARVGSDEGPGDSGMGFLAALDGRGHCFDAAGNQLPQLCTQDRECQPSQGGSQSAFYCANQLCLAPGTYYIQAKGDFGNAPKNFNVVVESIGECYLPRPDAFEADNTNLTATKIGKTSSIPDTANGFGRANSEIQDHSIISSGGAVDTDNLKVSLGRDELVSLTTGNTFPTPENGYLVRTAGLGQDTEMTLVYEIDRHLGICNSGPVSLSNTCYANFGTDGPISFDLSGSCDPDAPPTLINGPGNLCVSLSLFTINGVQRFHLENPLAFNDDLDAANGNFGAGFPELCLPYKGGYVDPTNDFIARITTSHGNVSRASLNYFYEAQARNLKPCNYENEPNNTAFNATPMALNSTAYGINDSNLTNVVSSDPAFYDMDYFGPWDVAGDTSVVMTATPMLIHPDADTELALYVGPDDGGNFYFLIDEEDDNSRMPVSVLEAAVMPANDLLNGAGIPATNAGYYTVVYANATYPNWYYKLTVVERPPIPETEPNDDCLSTPQIAHIGEKWTGSLEDLTPCAGEPITGLSDYDAYRISVDENTGIEFAATGDPAATDTAITLEDCDTGELLACDEDGFYPINGTYWSLITGCLPPGDYCVRVRPWYGLGPAYGLNAFYEIEFGGTPGDCGSFSPGQYSYDNGDSCQRGGGFDLFCGNPNTACGQPLD